MFSPNSEYSNLDRAFSHFNDDLFGCVLPGVLITIHQHPKARGYFRRRAFSHRTDVEASTDEICLCPDTHAGRTDHDILSTLSHEMCHLWQFHCGTPPRRCYHDKEFATKMEQIGLMPSDTGLPGGRKTGQRMSHYVIPGGAFDLSCQALLATGWQLQWEQPTRQTPASGVSTGAASGEAPKPTRKKFTCTTCLLSAYAKPTALLVCGQCLIEMG